MRSHIVLIRGYEEPNGFLEAAKRQLESLNIQTDLKLISRKDGTVKPKTVLIIGLAIATSIDALAVGLSLSVLKISILQRFAGL